MGINILIILLIIATGCSKKECSNLDEWHGDCVTMGHEKDKTFLPSPASIPSTSYKKGCEVACKSAPAFARVSVEGLECKCEERREERIEAFELVPNCFVGKSGRKYCEVQK